MRQLRNISDHNKNFTGGGYKHFRDKDEDDHKIVVKIVMIVGIAAVTLLATIIAFSIYLHKKK